MTTCKPRLYISKSFKIPLSIASGSDFTASEISQMSVKLTLTSNVLVTKTFQKSAGEITVSVDGIHLLIGSSDITTAGTYDIQIDMTDTSGGDTRLTPCPPKLIFYA